MTPAEALDRGRQSFGRGAWGAAYEHLSTAHRDSALDLVDLERLATAAHLVGEYEAAADLWAHAHQEFLREGDPPGAARCAFWLGFKLVNRGEHARGGGWFARASRILDGCGEDCVERGYLLLPGAIRATGEGDLEGAWQIFSQAVEAGERFADPDLVNLARHGQGRVLIRTGELDKGVALLDEVMVSVTGGHLSCLIAGDIYCSVLEACQECFDLKRAREWTEAMSGWLEAQPDLVPYRGQCLVHRSEVMQWSGRWDSAMEEAERACDWLTRPPAQPAAGAAYYQQAELHRLRGEFDAAEEAYRDANRWGRKPEPGLSLLRLARGQTDAAASGIQRAVDEARDRWARARLLPARIEILLAAGKVSEARSTAEELSGIADALDAAPLRAEALTGVGSVLLADADASGALLVLRRAWEAWCDLGAPYQAARTRMQIARACLASGDEDAAALEFDAVRWAFERLGAAPDVRRVHALEKPERSPDSHGLTPRQLEVLRHVAGGGTNRAIARALFISERTVERHVSDIFTKLGVSSRAAATAWAYEHQLV